MSLTIYRPLIVFFSVILSLSLGGSAALGQTGASQEIYSKEGVSIEVRSTDCHNIRNGTHKQYLLLSVSNSRKTDVSVSFKKNLWYDGKCSSCNSESDKYSIIITVPANGQLVGDCELNNGLRIFSKMLDLDKVAKLTNYELVDIEVNEAK